jgi:phage gp36-like protein
MAYITITQLQSRLGSTIYARLTDRIGGTTANAAVAQQLIDEAEGLADSYLAARFATPIDLAAHPELTDVLTGRVLDLTEYLAWRNSPFVSDLPERIRLLGDEATRWFSGVAAGWQELPASSPPAPTPLARSDSPLSASRPRLFTREELDGL